MLCAAIPGPEKQEERRWWWLWHLPSPAALGCAEWLLCRSRLSVCLLVGTHGCILLLCLCAQIKLPLSQPTGFSCFSLPVPCPILRVGGGMECLAAWGLSWWLGTICCSRTTAVLENRAGCAAHLHCIEPPQDAGFALRIHTRCTARAGFCQTTGSLAAHYLPTGTVPFVNKSLLSSVSPPVAHALVAACAAPLQ